MEWGGWIRLVQGGRRAGAPLPPAPVVHVGAPGSIEAYMGHELVAQAPGGRLSGSRMDPFESEWLPGQFSRLLEELVERHLPTDMTDYGQAEAMVRRAQEAFGGVDVLVAGVMLPAPIAEADPADWRRMVEVNLMGALHATRAVFPGMLERGKGHIVNVSSTSGRTHQPLFSVYAATKHGLAPSPTYCARRCALTASALLSSSPGPPSRSSAPTSTLRL